MEKERNEMREIIKPTALVLPFKLKHTQHDFSKEKQNQRPPHGTAITFTLSTITKKIVI